MNTAHRSKQSTKRKNWAVSQQDRRNLGVATHVHYMTVVGKADNACLNGASKIESHVRSFQDETRTYEAVLEVAETDTAYLRAEHWGQWC